MFDAPAEKIFSIITRQNKNHQFYFDKSIINGNINSENSCIAPKLSPVSPPNLFVNNDTERKHTIQMHIIEAINKVDSVLILSMKKGFMNCDVNEMKRYEAAYSENVIIITIKSHNVLMFPENKLPRPSDLALFPRYIENTIAHFENTGIRKIVRYGLNCFVDTKSSFMRRYFRIMSRHMAVAPIAPVALSAITLSLFLMSCALMPVDLTERASHVSARPSR